MQLLRRKGHASTRSGRGLGCVKTQTCCGAVEWRSQASELVTNAAQYGALSTQSGHVSVRWYRKLNGSPQFGLVWQETGGPRVEAPRKSGYGTGVVRNLIPYEFGGTVDLSFAPEGVRSRLDIPFDRVSSDNRNASAPDRLHYAGSSSAHVRLTALAGWARPFRRFSSRKCKLNYFRSWHFLNLARSTRFSSTPKPDQRHPKGPPSSPVQLRTAVWTGDAHDTRPNSDSQ